MDDQAYVKTYGNTALTEGTEDRPLVTFAVFAYNQEKYIRQAVEGAFSQTYSPLEIILSDDCSSDRTFKIMQEMAAAYRGPHLVKVRRGSKNIGVAQHFDTLIRQANGTLFVAAAGDDIAHANRTSVCVETANEHQKLGLIEVGCQNFSGNFDSIYNDQELHQNHTTRTLRLFSNIDVLSENIGGFIGAGRAYNRAAYLRFSPLIDRCPAEDTPALFRCLYGRQGALLAEKLVWRRIHDTNLSSQRSLSNMNFELLTKQYYFDLDDAHCKKMIDATAYNEMKVGFDRYSFRKQCAVDMHSGFRGGIGLINVLQSGHFSLREKFYLLRKGLFARARTDV